MVVKDVVAFQRPGSRPSSPGGNFYVSSIMEWMVLSRMTYRLRIRRLRMFGFYLVHIVLLLPLIGRPKVAITSKTERNLPVPVQLPPLSLH